MLYANPEVDAMKVSMTYIREHSDKERVTSKVLLFRSTFHNSEIFIALLSKQGLLASIVGLSAIIL